jgi:hypothetical protein
MAVNKFKGFCAGCKWLVQAGGGEVRLIDGKWTVWHEGCTAPDRVADRAKVADGASGAAPIAT